MDYGTIQGVWVADKGRCQATKQIPSSGNIDSMILYEAPVHLQFNREKVKRGR